MSFSQRVNREIQKKSTKISELSRITGIAHSTLSSMVKMGTSPTVDNAYKIARALDVSIEYLMTGEESPQSQPTSGSTLDKDKLYKAIVHVEKVIADSGGTMTPENRAKHILNIYNMQGDMNEKPSE